MLVSSTSTRGELLLKDTIICMSPLKIPITYSGSRHLMQTKPLSVSTTLILFLILAFAVQAPACAQKYSIIGLPNLEGPKFEAYSLTTEANSINDAGQIAGTSYLQNSFNAVRWDIDSRGQFIIHSLGSLNNSATGFGYSINNAGAVVGASLSSNQLDYHAILSQDGFLYDIHQDLRYTFSDPGNPFIFKYKQSYAYGINQSGAIVGQTTDHTGNHGNAFIYTNGVMSLLLPESWTLGYTETGASGINNQGQIVGWVGSTSDDRYGALWEKTSDGTYNFTPIYDFRPGRTGQVSATNAINNNAHIVGSSVYILGSSHLQQANLWKRETIFGPPQMVSHELHTLWPYPNIPDVYLGNSTAYAINDSDSIVGESQTTSGDTHATLWIPQQGFFGEIEWTIHDLNDYLPENSGWVLTTARGININGQICGNGLHNGVEQAFVLTPSNIYIDKIAMSDAHTLQVDVTALFKAPSAIPQTVSIDTVLNDTVLDSAHDPYLVDMLTWTIPQGVTGRVTHSFQIDLSHSPNGGVLVPRFKHNQKFTITARTKSLFSNQTIVDVQQAAVLLPVVVVPGIQPLGFLPEGHPLGGDGTYPELEMALNSLSSSYLTTHQILGEGYKLRHDSSYPTLYTLAYDTNYAPLEQGAVELEEFINFTVKRQTYADTINLYTHSKGGLVGRQFVETRDFSPDVINRMVMSEPPNLGSIFARTNPSMLGYNYQNMYPLWKWFRITPFQNYTETPNYELDGLNHKKMPPAISYTIIYSSSSITPYTETLRYIGNLPFVNSCNGDVVVPDFSALGMKIDPNFPDALGQLIPAFSGISIEPVQINGIHWSYTSNPLVQSAIVARFINDL
jgi:probable HAF family extracellular repeat protein